MSKMKRKKKIWRIRSSGSYPIVWFAIKIPPERKCKTYVTHGVFETCIKEETIVRFQSSVLKQISKFRDLWSGSKRAKKLSYNMYLCILCESISTEFSSERIYVRFSCDRKQWEKQRGRALFILRSAAISKCKQTYFWHLMFTLYFSWYFVIIKEKRNVCVLM